MEDFVAALGKLNSLLAEPEPGLMMWRSFVKQQWDEVVKEAVALGLQTESSPTTTQVKAIVAEAMDAGYKAGAADGYALAVQDTRTLAALALLG